MTKTAKGFKHSLDSSRDLNQLNSLKVAVAYSGALLQMKGHTHSLQKIEAELDVLRDQIEYSSLAKTDQRIQLLPDRIIIQSPQTGFSEERLNPRAAFKGHAAETKWDDFHLAYFVGASLRTALLSPRKKGASTHPAACSFDAKTNLLARIDYEFELCGNSLVSHFFSDYRLVDGLLFPFQHRILVRQEDGEVLPMPIVVSMDIQDLKIKLQTKKMAK